MTTRTTYEIQYKFKREGDESWGWMADHQDYRKARLHLENLIARNEPEYDYRIVRVDTTRTPMES